MAVGSAMTTMDPEISGILGELPEVAQMLGHVTERPDGNGSDKQGPSGEAEGDDSREDDGGSVADGDGTGGEALEDEDADGEADESDGSDLSDGSDDSDGDSDDAGKEKAPVSGNVQKRIDKLVAQREEALERATALERELKDLRERVKTGPEVVLAPSGDNPLADITDEAGLEQRLQLAMQVKRWALENPNGGTIKNGKGEDVDISEERRHRMLADAEEDITLHIPKRAQWLRDARSQEQVAREVYPSLFESGSEDAVRLQGVLKAWPEVMRFPDYKMVIGDYLAGVRAREAAAAAKVKAKPKDEQKPKKLAPPVPKVAAPPASKAGNGQQRKQGSQTPGAGLDQVIQQNGSLGAIENYLQEAGV